MTVKQYLKIKLELCRTFAAIGVVPTDIMLFQTVKMIVKEG